MDIIYQKKYEHLDFSEWLMQDDILQVLLCYGNSFKDHLKSNPRWTYLENMCLT